MYELMALVRACDDRLRRGLSAGEFACTYWPATGQEAIAAALGTVLRPEDQLVTTYRGLHDQIAKGVPLGPLVAEILTRRTGVNAGKGGCHAHRPPPSGLVLSTGIVGSGMPIAVGVGLAARMRGADQVTVASFGDGATGTGSFHEAVNLAALWDLPIVFLCQNNRYAEMTPTAEAQPVARRGRPGPGLRDTRRPGRRERPRRRLSGPCRRRDRARSGGGPTLLECMTFRLWGHYFGDPMRYIPADGARAGPPGRAGGPLPSPPADRRRARRGHGRRHRRQAAGSEVESAFSAALAAEPPDPDEAFVDVYRDSGGQR